MSATRDEILRELGLAPTWRLREPAPGLPAADAVPATAPTLQASEPVTVRGLPKVPSLDARALQIATLDWPQLRESVAGCVACPLHKGRNKTVFGVGDEAADWLFVGEGPGAEEDAQGRALCRPGRQAARQHARRDKIEARAQRLHRQRGQMPAARQPQSGARRSGAVRALPASPDRADQAEADRRARQGGGGEPAEARRQPSPVCAAKCTDIRAFR